MARTQLDQLREKREHIITQRNNAIMSQNYILADILLLELQTLNGAFNQLLKEEYLFNERKKY